MYWRFWKSQVNIFNIVFWMNDSFWTTPNVIYIFLPFYLISSVGQAVNYSYILFKKGASARFLAKSWANKRKLVLSVSLFAYVNYSECKSWIRFYDRQIKYSSKIFRKTPMLYVTSNAFSIGCPNNFGNWQSSIKKKTGWLGLMLRCGSSQERMSTIRRVGWWSTSYLVILTHILLRIW